MKKYILFLLLFPFFLNGVEALSVEYDDLSLTKGSKEQVKLSANFEEEVTEVSFTLIYSTYDIPVTFTGNSNMSSITEEGTTYHLVFSEPVTGNTELGLLNISVSSNPKDKSGTINIYNATAISTNKKNIKLEPKTIKVTIGSEKKLNSTTKKETDGMLSKIESSIVNIELKKDTYDYSVTISSDIKTLDLKPIAIDDSYTVSVSNQTISELKDNTITISVSSDTKKEEYNIKVNVVDKTDDIKIDDSEFTETYKYKEKWSVLIVTFILILIVGIYINKRIK